MKRVVITGIGALTPLGNTFAESWQAAKAGSSGIASITKFDTSLIPWKMAGELKGFDASLFLGQKEVRRTAPFIHYGVAAALMAVEDAGLSSHGTDLHPSLSNGGVIIGSSRGGISVVENAIRNDLMEKKRVSAYLMPSTTIGMAPSYVAQKLGVMGYSLGISNACASGANAIGEAYRLIKTGFLIGPVIAGGTEAPLCRICVEGYGTSGVLSRGKDRLASRPFDRSRDGFVISEGACMMVLEEEGHALGRGADIYGEVIGYGNSADAFHQTRPDREGEIRAIRSAMEDAGLSPEDLDYVNAHGTSTPLGDRTESDAIAAVLGDRAPSVPVSALKSMTGHMLAASGALEAAFAVMSIREGIIPATLNLSNKDEGCTLDLVTETREGAIRTAVSHSFGFGGVNAVIILRRYF